MDSKGKDGSFTPIILVMAASLMIASFWNSVPAIKNTVHSILNPSAGILLNWNLTWGMIILVFVITLITTLAQKYGTDQKALRELKKEQKILQEEMKKYKEHPEKLMELQKKQLEFIPKTMKLSMRAIAFTGVPLILFFRWFNDYFTEIGNPDVIFGLGWFGTYFIATIIFSSIMRKYLKVV
ncbi:MAG: EMC3/TMCO1 family protein [Candidatus Pacearchaeota archaeon]|jgi:uncharacterized membrane protein (DUF106 family)